MGLELISQKLEYWAEKQGNCLEFIQWVEPTQNAYIQRFNRPCREEVLERYLFDTLAEAREITEAWLEDYNAIRPHESLGGLAPYRHAAEVGP